MAGLSHIIVLLLCAFIVEGNFVADSIKRAINNEKVLAKQQVEAAANKARKYAEDVLTGISNKVSDRESWLDNQVEKHVSNITGPCKPDMPAAKNKAHASLWKCLQLARVVTDGFDIAAKGFEVTANILDTADYTLQGLTACIIAPSQSPSDLAACYLSALGTLASGVAQNIIEVEHYITLVKRDVGDIHASIELCGNQTVKQAANIINAQQKLCQKK